MPILLVYGAQYTKMRGMIKQEIRSYLGTLLTKLSLPGRWDMSILETVWTQVKARSLATLKEGAAASGIATKAGSIEAPLLNIELDHVMLDELHLLLRVSDVLLRNLILMAIRRDRQEKSTENITSLKAAIRSCGVTFEIWEDADKRKQGYDWTSLTGKDKKRLLKVMSNTVTLLNVLLLYFLLLPCS